MRTRPMAEVRVRIISMPDSTKVGKSTPRWERLFDNVTVFQAVLGRQIGTTDPRLSVHLYHRLKSGATRNPFEIGVNMILMQNKPQIGCALSHIELWKEVVAVVVSADGGGESCSSLHTWTQLRSPTAVSTVQRPQPLLSHPISHA